MARWKLNEAHYLFAHAQDEETEWEYKETDRTTGRERRKRFKVPMYCDVGMVVCYAGSEHADDNGAFGPITIEGPPTPAMTPLDDEAKALCAEHAPNWVHPIDSLPGQGFSEALLTTLTKQLEAAMSKGPTIGAATPVGGVSREEFEALQAQLAALMAQNAELQTKPAVGKRRAL
jgi:hypothetical protein